ncbi:MAG TPA: HAMP domain-containing sensor histidine kinase [Acidimicrobiales bacterium]|nr:HAMP domain-containing sensor histidine kinase [Acidimicrobiales bacterium]
MRLGITARITAVFGLGALLLSILMGGLSYFTVRHFLLAGRESAAQHQAFNNAVLVRTQLQLGQTSYTALLGNIDAGSDAHSVLYHGTQYYDSSLSVNASSIPLQLRKDVLAGGAATQTYRTSNGTAEIVVGVPMPSVQAAYFEVFDLSDLDHTLRVLGLTLLVAGIVTTVLGVALGRFASVRSLRPLADVSRAAGAIAGGDLDTRLDEGAADPDLKGLTLSFNAMVDQLQERIEREARFNSDVSHELRSPLTTLAASLEVLEAGRDDMSPRSQRALQLLSDDLHRFQRMVADLLEMSRADAGSVDVFLEEVNVAELVRRSVETGYGHMDGQSRNGAAGPPDVRVDPAVSTWRVGVDKRRFERVMVNLMENADHYGGGVTDIAVAPGPDEHVEVIVDDAGPGIDPLERLKVFERFYRGSASGRRGTGTGTGLGLALVHEHMRVMQGDVRVESSPAGGARFVLTLPVLPEDEELAGDELAGEPAPEPVDDEPIGRHAARARGLE